MNTTKLNAATVRTMNVEELRRFLEAEGFPTSVTNKLQDEEIDGMCLLLLTEANLDSLKFKTGPKIRLRNMIENMKMELAVEQPRTQENQSFTGILSVLTGSPMQPSGSVEKAEIASGEASYPSDFFGSSSSAGWSSATTFPTLSGVTNATGEQEVNYDVFQMLENDPDGEKFQKKYLRKKDPVISNEQRKTIVRVAVNGLTTQIKSLYPTSVQKNALAEAIVDAFPCLKGDLPGVSPHSAFYNNKTNSYIETQLKAMRKSNPQKRKLGLTNKEMASKNKKRKRDSLKNDFETEKQQVIWMQKLVSNHANKSTIVDYMVDTFHYRRLQIDSRILKSATDILEEYPRFVDYENGALIIAEYYLINKEASGFENFEKHYQDRLIALATRGAGQDLYETSDRCLSALICCVKLQPSKKIITSEDQILDQLIVFREENWNIRDLEQNRTSYSSQPFILCLGTMKSPSRYYVVIENTLITCGKTIEHAFQVLYCSFYSFGLQYPKRLRSFYRFFDDVVFKLTSKNKGNLSASSLAFEARIKAVELPLQEGIDPDGAQ